MPTPNERKALLFLAGVAVLGGAVHLVAALRDADRPMPAEELTALDRQLRASESAAASARAERSAKSARGGKGRSPRARPDSVSKSVGTPMPSTPIFRPPDVRSSSARANAVGIVVDLDRAGAEQIAALPGIGPSLARRIVHWRDSAGGLGSLDGLDCVSGVGPALLARVRPHVTFSGSQRPSCTVPRAARERRRARAP